MSRVTTLVNHETGHICVMALTSDNELIEIDLPLDLAVEVAEALENGRKQLEN